MNGQNISRRDFLKLFTRGAARSAGEVVTAAVPAPAAVKRERPRPAALAAGNGDAPQGPLAYCARCCVPFAESDDTPLCPDCRSLETRQQSVLPGFGGNQPHA